ncbi:uncharacterized protein [Rutidosis leptorrhynchoides]|uniref:uncharacterized protein n=1 Tax=Rutidosis leptorrhynchoides TaxID=125765 RepID=UPI003A996AE2
MAWIKWDQVLNSFSRGGLNIGSLKAFNLALIIKWQWRYLSSPDDMWVKVIKAIHGNYFDCTIGSSPWCSIVHACQKVVTDSVLSQNYIHLEVGNGRNVSFWHDSWCGSSPLVSRFNGLYYLDINRLDSVADKWVEGEWRWVWSREEIGSRNLTSLWNLLQELQNVNVSNREDCWKCSLNGDGLFTVKDTREHIDRSILYSHHVPTSWVKTLPKKVNVFWWRFKLDALPLRWNLSTKGIMLDSQNCPVCDTDVERLKHLFLVYGCNRHLEVGSYLARLWAT